MSWAWVWFGCFALTAWALVEAGKWIWAATIWIDCVQKSLDARGRMDDARDASDLTDSYRAYAVGGTSSDD